MRLSSRPDDLKRAAALLTQGELVAFPTETVYGLGARADRSEAVRAIYTAKGRPAENPSIVHVASAEAAFALAVDVPAAARSLAARFWPGPLTLVLRVRPGAIAPETTAGGSTVAVRVPAHPVARALLELVGLPIAAPSANRSTAISPTTAEHVEKSLGTELTVVDGGPTGYGIESTIVDVTRSPFVVLRRGNVTLDDLAMVGPATDRGDDVVPEGVRMRSPGSSARHYAPRVPLELAPREALSARAQPTSGLVCLGAAPQPDAWRAVESLPTDSPGYARELYAALHRLEDAGVDRIVVENVPGTPAWAAVRDRLVRASHAPG
jgi:L-threonylcarbamoyladenylate synthase